MTNKHYSTTKEYRDFLKMKREESKREKNLFPYIETHARVIRALRKLLNNGSLETFYEYQLAYEHEAADIVNKACRSN